MAPLGEKTVLEHVIDACVGGASMVNQHYKMKKLGIFCNVAICIPEGDPVKSSIPRHIRVVEGPEHDVLTRYHLMAKSMGSDAIVRITSDCPEITDYIISKHVGFAVLNSLDYLSNVDEECRFAPDGFDCEFISRTALEYACQKAMDPKDREHVTTYLRKNKDPQFRYGMVMHKTQNPDEKLSVDLPEDLERLQKKKVRFERARRAALDIYGEGNVFFL